MSTPNNHGSRGETSAGGDSHRQSSPTRNKPGQGDEANRDGQANGPRQSAGGSPDPAHRQRSNSTDLSGSHQGPKRP